MAGTGDGGAVASPREVPRAKAEYLQVQVVVLVGLANPLHADPANGRGGARVGWPHDRDDLLDALLESPPRKCEPRFCRVAVAPGVRMELPADLVFLVVLQRHQSRTTDHRLVLAPFDRPAAGRCEQVRVIGDPSLQDKAHRGNVTNSVHGWGQPPCDLGV